MRFLPNGDCLTPDSMAVTSFMILSISGTMVIVGLFLFKVAGVRNAFGDLILDQNDDDVYLKVIKKHSVILFWITITSIVLTVLYILFNQYIGIMTPIIDNTATAVAIFLSFSFNSKWYKSCQCDKCADSLFNLIFCCLHRHRREESNLSKEIARNNNHNIRNHHYHRILPIFRLILIMRLNVLK